MACASQEPRYFAGLFLLNSKSLWVLLTNDSIGCIVIDEVRREPAHASSTQGDYR